MEGHHRSAKEGTFNSGGEMGYMEDFLEKGISQLS